MSRFEEVVIAGGGPAGAHCACELSDQGLEPVILDHSFPGEKPCGGGILPSVFEKFPFLEKFRSTGSTFGDFRIISCTDNEVISGGLKNGLCISRKLFDQKLIDMAKKKGARFLKEKVIDVRNDNDKWKIKTDKRTLSSKILVGADGVNSIVRNRTVGPISKNNLALTFGYLTSQISINDATIKFLADIPSYIWIFPGKGYGNIGISSDLGNGKNLQAILDSFINKNYPQVKKTSKYCAMVPSAKDSDFFKLPCSGKNWILIGDAAGHVDPISGGGILYALLGGKIAAQAIRENDPALFEKLWRKEYGAYLEARSKNKEEFYNPLTITMSMLTGLAKKNYFWPTK